MKRFGGIFFLVAGLVFYGLTGGSALAGTLPAESNLAASGAVSWPSQKGFDYRLTVKAGDQGADFELQFPHPDWGVDGVGGTFLSLGDAALDGPGQLKTISTTVADPTPTACFRGGFGSVLNTYNLKLDPGEQTTVTVPATLLAAPLEGMGSGLTAILSTGSGAPRELNAPLTIGGTHGVRIAIESNRWKARNWQRFTLTGQTHPALPNQWLQVRADPKFWKRQGKSPKAHVILTVRTDKDGSFVSRPVHLGRSATWVLTSRPLDPEGYDGGPSCNGTVETTDGWYRPSWIDLKGFTFVSTRVKGHNMGFRRIHNRDGSIRSKRKNRVRLAFSLGRRFSPNIPDMQDWPLVPSVSPSTGCNSMGGEVSVKNGLMRTGGDFFTTLVLCSPDNDSWIAGLLQKGLKAAMKNRQLVLRRGKTLIVLKRRY
jgi:hypothetical protein